MFKNTNVVLLIVYGVSLVGLSDRVLAADKRIQLEVVTVDGAPLEAAQVWSRQLADLKLDGIRIRGAGRGDDELGIEKTPTGFVVTGAIGSDNQLVLPGGRFRLGDRTGLDAWFKKLKSDGPPHEKKQESAFGLSEIQLVGIFDRLSVPITSITRGKSVRSLAKTVRQLTNVDVRVQASVRSKIGKPNQEELQGVSAGTALAAALRPLGLVFVPRLREENSKIDIVLVIKDVRVAPESWPVGWPRKGRVPESIPKLFDNLEAEIAGTSLADVLAAFQERIQVPFLLDQNSLARQQIDPTTISIRYPAKRTFYKKVLDSVLMQNGLQSEVREDEAGKPFVWISTSKVRTLRPNPRKLPAR